METHGMAEKLPFGALSSSLFEWAQQLHVVVKVHCFPVVAGRTRTEDVLLEDGRAGGRES